MENAANDIKEITKAVAYRTDWVQGAGGNTSVKYGNQMLVKASGNTLAALIDEDAYVGVNVDSILAALAKEDIDITTPNDKQYLEAAIVKSTIQPTNLKASMETAFHCLYHKYVLHTHNVYANIFLCSSGYELLSAIFTGDEWYTVAMAKDYYTPGVVLSWHLYNQFRFDEAMPNVTFLPNHGVIYSHNDKDKLLAIHNEVEQRIIKALEPLTYPTYSIQQENDKLIIYCDYLLSICKKNELYKIFDELLFPDQAVYVNENDFSLADNEAKFYIDINNNYIRAKAGLAEAKAVIEIIVAYYYIQDQIAVKKWEPLTINYDWHNLTNMQSEQYRKSLL